MVSSQIYRDDQMLTFCSIVHSLCWEALIASSCSGHAPYGTIDILSDDDWDESYEMFATECSAAVASRS